MTESTPLARVLGDPKPLERITIDVSYYECSRCDTKMVSPIHDCENGIP